jgi:glycosyltransferase involved in cell wall biosynthesis
VALLSEVFCQNMGYLENMLPVYLARLGIDVHVVTMGLQPYYQTKGCPEIYRGFAEEWGASPRVLDTGKGYTLHILPHRRVLGYMKMVGLGEKLRSLHPDIVQTTATIGWLPLQAALIKAVLDYKLFTGNHHHASVFPLANKRVYPWSLEILRCRLTRTLPGWLVSLCAEKCYAITPDCADIAARFFGVPREKIDICPLGVDTSMFAPILSQQELDARLALRGFLGFSPDEIVCVYTGRFTQDKNPLLLAAAIDRLQREGHPFRGLFVGNGEQSEAIQKCRGCVTHPFVPVHELGVLFRASDIAVWPTQESTSMLDAAACGLPIVVNHTMSATERIEGNGVTYQLNDCDDLSRVLLELRDANERHRLGFCGAEKIAREFSWNSVASRRLRDYHAVLGVQRIGPEKPVSKELVGRID